MAGYFSERINTGTHDPLQAKAIVFAQGDTRVALVFCDLIGIPLDVSTRARTLASQEIGLPVANIAIAATHAHTGPLYFGVLRNYFHEQAMAKEGRDPRETVDYATWLVDKLVLAITQAQRNVKPVRVDVGVAMQTPPLSFNRRYHMKDGTVRFNPGQQNPDIVRAAGPIDSEVGIVLLRNADEQALAALTVFAMHLDTMGGTNYSADYPFYLERELRKTLGDHFVSLFGAGTCGDINHIDVTTKGRRSTEELGTLLAKTVLAERPKLRPLQMPSLAVRSEVVQIPLQKYSPEQVAQANKDLAKVGTRDLPFLKQVEACKIVDLQQRWPGSKASPDVHVFRLSKQVAIVTLPGEVFVELGLAIKKASPFKTTFVIELSNDNLAYIPTQKAFAEGSYEIVNSRVEPGGGEKLVDVAVRLLKELVE